MGYLMNGKIGVKNNKYKKNIFVIIINLILLYI